jgi:hypothetical protein
LAKFDWDKYEDAEPAKSKAKSFNWDDYPDSDQSLGQDVLNTVVGGLNAYDSVSGAPTRAALNAYADGQSPLLAFKNQFGEDPSLVPDSVEIAKKLGLSDERPLLLNEKENLERQKRDEMFNPGFAASMKQIGKDKGEVHAGFSPAQVGGVAIDVGVDYTNLLPLGSIAKGVTWGTSAALKGAANLTGKAANAVSKLNRVENAVDALKNTRFAKVVSESADGAKQALDEYFDPQVADNFAKLATTAQKHGIDANSLPASSKFGLNSVPSGIEQTLRESAAGAPEIKKFQDTFLKVQDATDKTVYRIAGDVLPPNQIEAGNIIRQGFDDSVEELFQKVDHTYNSVIDQVPGIRLSPDAEAHIASHLNGLEKWAKGRIKRGITNTDRGQAEQILRAIESVREGNGSLKQTYEAMQDIGRHAFKTGKNSLADVPVDIEKFRKLYFTLRDGFIETTKKSLGEDIANDLIQSNQIITDFMTDKNVVASLIGNKNLAPETLFNSLVLKGDSNKIAALKRLMPPEKLQQLKGAFLESLITRNPNGTVSFGSLHGQLRSKRNVIEALFSPEEIREFAELVELGNSFGDIFQSSARTSRGNALTDIAKSVKSGASNRAALELIHSKVNARGMSPAHRVNLAPKTGSRLNRPVRGKTEEALKAAQMVSLTANQDSEQSAAKRRLEEIKKRKAAEGK